MKKRLQRRIVSGDRDRRGAIRHALFRRICDKGYASTSLTDLAAAVGISPSHVLYYYPSKDAVLEDLFAVATRRMHDDLESMPWTDSASAFDALADYFFGGGAFSQDQQGAMLQFWALSANYPALRKIKADFDAALRDRLTQTFQQAKRLPGLSAGDAAQVAHALLAGLLSTTYFTEAPPSGHARGLFRRALAHLAGEGQPTRERAPRAVRKPPGRIAARR
jgi:AcrR family transcriptional regulator